MICSCLAADGERSKRDEAEGGGAAPGGGPRCDWPVGGGGRQFGPGPGGGGGLAAAAIGCRGEVCRGAAALLSPFGEWRRGLRGTARTGE
ncbi:hypothetical protein EYF80_066424 [Liparis tanakae]|uniref:Uncharacterized protein n=1 Tax=Liparis tanakae TaxID=230148 RepID=A0A4Z2E3U9_9TELE|nr:hypothetical protein EYF80_066424 [Liparis tanakae]